jgi:hypothetical protein
MRFLYKHQEGRKKEYVYCMSWEGGMTCDYLCFDCDKKDCPLNRKAE